MHEGWQLPVHGRHHVGDVAHTVCQAGFDLVLALAPMRHERLHMGPRGDDGRAVGGPVHRVLALQQEIQALHVARHVAVWRRHDAGGPAHHMVAGEECLFFAQAVADVVRRVARRVQALERPAIPFDDLAVLDAPVGHERHVAALLHRHALLVLAGAMRPVGVGGRVTHLAQQRAAGRMVIVGVGHQHVGDALPFGGLHDGVDVGGVRRARVDDRHVAAADDVGAGAVERERAGVLRDHPPNQRAQRRRLAILEIQLAPEGNLRHRALHSVRRRSLPAPVNRRRTGPRPTNRAGGANPPRRG